MNYNQLIHTLAESFNALADEVQALIDHKTVLEHKLRFAHEQFQFLADKYAPAVTEVSETLAKLQLPASVQSSLTARGVVPLPKRAHTDAQHQIALFIREGRKVAQKLSSAVEMSSSSKEALSTAPGTDNLTSLSTVLEQDFTVEGQKGQLNCPFSPQPQPAKKDIAHSRKGDVEDPTPHHSSDPICAAMYEEENAAPPPATAGNSSAQCPIRFLDKHSPEEIAHYVETHKHEIPRSHEVCVRRYQKNEEQIRKLDAKYGSLVNMIQDLSHLHKPMMPHSQQGLEEVDRASTKRVENWANGVSSASEAGDPDKLDEEERHVDHEGDDRESHFDRPLKEVRVGESPSRPWGISVPVYNQSGQQDDQRAESPPPAPVHMPQPSHSSVSEVQAAPKTGKCPFDHTKFSLGNAAPASMRGFAEMDARVERPYTPVKNQVPGPSPMPFRPTFVNPPPQPVPQARDEKPVSQPPPQMVFNISGPVFIGYPMEQAMEFMQAYQGNR